MPMMQEYVLNVTIKVLYRKMEAEMQVKKKDISDNCWILQKDDKNM